MRGESRSNTIAANFLLNGLFCGRIVGDMSHFHGDKKAEFVEKMQYNEIHCVTC